MYLHKTRRLRRNPQCGPGDGNRSNKTTIARYGVERGSRVVVVSDSLDIEAFLERFRERAKAVRNRPMPPVEGSERARFRERMQVDFMDFAMIGDAAASLESGFLTLRIDLRPAS